MSTYSRLNEEHLQYFRSILGEENVVLDEESLDRYGRDETEDLVFPPDVVLKPGNTEEISSIMKFCFEQNLPVTPRAAGTGLSGGALPIHAGVLLSIERLNQITEIDEANLQVTTQPGVITQVLQEAVIDKGLYYPVDPASRGSCFIGGNIAENSGGPRAVKYGVVKDYVLNLEVVLPSGEIIQTGANVLKNSTGYNLTQLMVGSEGTLGIVTSIVLKLIPHPPHDISILVPFRSAIDACKAVAEIFKAGITPSAMEFMERDAIDWTLNFRDDINMSIADEDEAHLLIEVDGFRKEDLNFQMESIVMVLDAFDTGEILMAETSTEKDALWKLRRSVAEAVKANSTYKEEDTVVPRAYLPELLKGVKDIGAKHGFKSVCYGHAGDGNLHVNIIKGDMDDKKWNEDLSKGITEIFQLVHSLNGTISGEHGIGWVQKPYLSIVFNETELNLMKEIKAVFDPKNILNPGKIFD